MLVAIEISPKTFEANLLKTVTSNILQKPSILKMHQISIFHENLTRLSGNTLYNTWNENMHLTKNKNFATYGASWAVASHMDVSKTLQILGSNMQDLSNAHYNKWYIDEKLILFIFTQIKI